VIKIAFCPYCGKPVPENVDFCPNCGSYIKDKLEITSDDSKGTKKIKDTHSISAEKKEAEKPDVYYSLKSQGLTVLFALFGLIGIMGIGHLYVGKVRRGLIIFFVGILSFVLMGYFAFFLVSMGPHMPPVFGYAIFMTLGAIFWLILFIWQIFDANRLAVEYNENIRKTGKAPW